MTLEESLPGVFRDQRSKLHNRSHVKGNNVHAGHKVAIGGRVLACSAKPFLDSMCNVLWEESGWTLWLRCHGSLMIRNSARFGYLHMNRGQWVIHQTFWSTRQNRGVRDASNDTTRGNAPQLAEGNALLERKIRPPS